MAHLSQRLQFFAVDDRALADVDVIEATLMQLEALPIQQVLQWRGIY
jgi:hypothetical protein